MNKRDIARTAHRKAMNALPKAQRAIVEYIADNTDLWWHEIPQFSKSAIRELVKKGVIEKHFQYATHNYYYDFSYDGRNTYYLDGILDDLKIGKECR